MRILWLANVVPFPPHGGVQLRVLHLLKRIARLHDVTLGCHAWDQHDVERARELTELGLRTVAGPIQYGTWRTHSIPALRCLLAGEPPELVQYQSPELHALVRNESFDILQVEETLLTPYAASLAPGSNTRTVLTFHNMHFVQAARIAAIEKQAWLRWWRWANAVLMKRYEPAIAARFDRVIAVSEPDRALLHGAAPDVAVDVIPNGVDTVELNLLPEPAPEFRQTILFVGSLFYRPCVDGAEWLVREILPILRQRIPGIQVWIVGKGATPEVLALAGDGVFVASSVPEIRPYYERAAVAVAPLRAGGGSRLKILEAMALGRPVVSTTIGAEGLDVRHEENILIADDPYPFASAIALLLFEDAVRKNLVRQARCLVENRYDWESIAGSHLRIYEELMAK